MLIENADENNPSSKLSRCTPLHLAAYSGHFSTFKLIFDWALQKQPKGIHAKASQEFSGLTYLTNLFSSENGREHF